MEGRVSSGEWEEEESVVLSFLSFSAMHSHDGSSRRQVPASSMQGVLWKRRDVFRNRWRPRWFVLHPQQGILTYYLLNNTSQPAHEPTSTIHRRRADSDISTETIDYDVVPRGSIFLGNATTEANDFLTRPEERLYVLTITDLESNAKCHLACRSSTARDRWLVKIQEAIVQHQNQASQPDVAYSESANSSRDVGQALTQCEIVPPITEAAPVLPANDKWETIQTEDLTTGIPPIILSRIDAILEKHLSFATIANHPDFKVAYETQGVKVASHSVLPIRRSTYIVPRHHPADYLGLVWNIGYASELEPNMRTRECLRVFNTNTMIQYTAYHPIWPSAPRDFCTVAHWRLVQNEKKERALVYVAFSCPESNKMKASPSNYVRATLNLSLQCWSPLSNGGCSHISLFSVDMNGAIPNPLIQTLQQQQATIPPRAMDAHLSKISPSKDELHEMDYGTLVRAIEAFSDRKKPEFRHGNSIAVVCPPSKPSFKVMPDIGIWTETAVLLVPLLLHYILVMLDFVEGTQTILSLVAIMIAMVFCIRWVLIRQLLRFFVMAPRRSLRPLSLRRLVCRVSMDIAPVLDFLENERQAKVAFNEGKDLAEWRLEHVLLGAISQAIANHPVLVERSLPFFPALYNLDLQVRQIESGSPIVIPSRHQDSIQAIANYCTQSEDSRRISVDVLVAAVFGVACDVSIHDLSMAPSSRPFLSHIAEAPATRGSLISVVAYVSMSDKEKHSTPLSTLDLFFSFERSDLESCESFMKDVERFIQFPELCLQSR